MAMSRQYGAIPYLRKRGELKVVLVTSASGYWIFPKGNLEEHLGKRATAQLEAFKEAGVNGTVDPELVYRTVVMIRGGREVRLSLYPLAVDKVCESWPEESRRRRKIVGLDEARSLVASNGLRKCIDAFARDFAK